LISSKDFGHITNGRKSTHKKTPVKLYIKVSFVNKVHLLTTKLTISNTVIHCLFMLVHNALMLTKKLWILIMY